MKWIKKNRIFNVSKNFGWMNSHAQVPTVLVMQDRLRIYFGTRPKPKFSLAAFIDVDINDPQKILYIHDEPVLQAGNPGLFDEHGLNPSFVCYHPESGQVLLYYGGWSQKRSIPHSCWTGLAVSEDGGENFKKQFCGPILDRTPTEPFSAAGCYILRVKDKWHMWYGSGVEWIRMNNQYEECYVIKHAVSDDGIVWLRDNEMLLPSKHKLESNTRPSVIYKDGKYHMWFCYRGIEDFRDGKNSYRIGYGWSTDLKQWVRDDEQAGIDISEDGWDSKMIAYPYIVKTTKDVLMFYNGNGFGQSGFGYAVLDGN